jgi:hypothetical protein
MRVKSALALYVAICLTTLSPAASADGNDWLGQACAAGRVALEPGRWGIEVDARMRHFAFTDGGLFVFVEDKKTADSTLRIIRVDPPRGND